MHCFLARGRSGGHLVSFGDLPVEIGGLHICFKGYVANKSEFLSELATSDSGVDADVASVASGYRKWGAGLNQHVFGEFAVAIYDAEIEALLLAQDCLGIVPLYYRADSSGISVSTRIDDLSQELDDGDLDEEYIADYLCFGDHHGERTPFKCVSQLTPGFSVRFRRGIIRKYRSWAFDNIAPIRYRDVRDYLDELRRLVTEGVKAALPTKGIALCEVSGGLDSSTVACIACRHFPADRLHALSYVYSDSRTADESLWSKAVIDRCGMKWHRLDIDAARPFTELPLHRCGQPYQTMVNVALTKAYAEIVNNNHIAVVLTGVGGDGVLLGDGPEPFFLADLFWRGRLVSVWKGLREWTRASREPRPLLYSWHRCLVRASVNRLRRFLIHDQARRIPWISSRFRLARSRNGRQRKTWVPNSRGVVESWFLEQVMRSAKMVSLRDDMNGIGVEFRHPLMYVPLVKFMCATPWELKFSPSQDRVLHRQAFAEILPSKIVRRKTKGDPSEATYRGLETGQWWKAIRAGTHIAARGYVNRERWSAAVDLARLGRCENIMHFKSAATLEVWLQGLHRSYRTAANTPNHSAIYAG